MHVPNIVCLFCSLGQLSAMAGIDKSDFQPLGRPQFSSTIGTHLDDAASLTKGDLQDVGAKTDVFSLVRRCNVMFRFFFCF